MFLQVLSDESFEVTDIIEPDRRNRNKLSPHTLSLVNVD